MRSFGGAAGCSGGGSGGGAARSLQLLRARRDFDAHEVEERSERIVEAEATAKRFASAWQTKEMMSTEKNTSKQKKERMHLAYGSATS